MYILYCKHSGMTEITMQHLDPNLWSYHLPVIPRIKGAKQVPWFNTKVFIAYYRMHFVLLSNLVDTLYLNTAVFVFFICLMIGRTQNMASETSNRPKNGRQMSKQPTFPTLFPLPDLPQHTLHILESMVLNPGCKVEPSRKHLKVPTWAPFPEILFQLVWEDQIRHHILKALQVTPINRKSP